MLFIQKCFMFIIGLKVSCYGCELIILPQDVFYDVYSMGVGGVTNL